MTEIQLIQTYEFDGTYGGFTLMKERLKDEDAYYENGMVYFNNSGVRYQKGDHYQIRLPEEFKAIG